MILDEDRLNEFVLQRSNNGSPDADSGLATPGTATTYKADIDLQIDGRIVPGQDQQQGRFQGYSYHLGIAPGDKLFSTAHGALEVVSVETWADEEPTHVQLSLRAL